MLFHCGEEYVDIYTNLMFFQDDKIQHYIL